MLQWVARDARHQSLEQHDLRRPDAARNGDVLIDTGFSLNAEAQMNELPPSGRDFGSQIVSGAKDRISILDELRTVGEAPARVTRILITRAHYDHLGGATGLAAPIYVSPAEATWIADQATHPTITPPSLIAAVKPRLRILTYDSGSYLSFERARISMAMGRSSSCPYPATLRVSALANDSGTSVEQAPQKHQGEL